MLTTPLHRKTTRALAVAALLAAATLSACGDLQNNTIPVDMVAYRPDGALVMFTRAAIEIYDGTLKTHINRISLDALVAPPYTSDTRLTYGLSADGTVAAIAYDRIGTPGVKSRVAIYRIPDGDLLNLFELDDAATPTFSQGVGALAPSPDGTRLYVRSIDDEGWTAAVLDTATAAPIWTQSGDWLLPVWSPDGAVLFAMNEDVAALTSSLDALDAGTGAVKWRTHLTDPNSNVGGITALALVGNGTSLTAPQFDPSNEPPACLGSLWEPGECPPVTSFWSAADGTLAAQLPPVPLTMDFPGNAALAESFVCNATDLCAERLVEYTPPTPNDLGSFVIRPAPTGLYVRLYRTDGTELQRLLIKPGGASANGSMAISPDGQFIAIADDPVSAGGVKLFSVADGTIVGSQSFPTDTF